MKSILKKEAVQKHVIKLAFISARAKSGQIYYDNKAKKNKKKINDL